MESSKVDHRPAPQGWQLLDGASLHQRHFFGEIEDLGDLVRSRSAADNRWRISPPRSGSLPCSMLTWSIPSISVSRTLTCSPVRVGMYSDMISVDGQLAVTRSTNTAS